MERKIRRLPENWDDLGVLLKANMEKAVKTAEMASILEHDAAVTVAYIAGRLDGVTDALKIGKQSA